MVTHNISGGATRVFQYHSSWGVYTTALLNCVFWKSCMLKKFVMLKYMKHANMVQLISNYVVKIDTTDNYVCLHLHSNLPTSEL